MKKKLLLLISFLLVLLPRTFSQSWKAQWISTPDSFNEANTWLGFRKETDLKRVPATAVARIAADSKYWMWINGQMVVFEGGIKRGPNAEDTYYDQIDIARWLKPGKNIIALMVWYFGKDGFSHNSSGAAGLLFDCQSAGWSVLSDKTWQAIHLDAYQTAAAPLPNYRLPESSIRFDAGKDKGRWYADTTIQMEKAMEHGPAGSKPWNVLVRRPIPMFKDFGMKAYESKEILKSTDGTDTLICKLPYNAQVTPYFEIDAPEEGLKITMFTDNYLKYNGGDDYIRSEYLTRKGIQQYESFGWVNGHYLYYLIPKGVKVLNLGFRETGYDTEFAGSFSCSDPFFNKLWEKARRTLYLNIRDTYMDCPDRERAQWTGDAVNQSGQAFYSLSVSSHAMARKWLYEIADWQRPDGTLFAPVPSGNWNNELPDQLLATIGYYGLWNYYLNTGDLETLGHVYPAAAKYLALWKPDGKGLVQFRGGNWTWGDWGDEKDIELIFNSFYYMAMKGLHNAALALGKPQDALRYEETMKDFKMEFNRRYWNGLSYRDPQYKGKTDDRAQALAVVSGLAEHDKYENLLHVFQEEQHASPYMEKYVMEALFQMGEVDFALDREKQRFERMVNHPDFTTLWEGWNFNDPKYGGGTINHSWSGGALTVLSQYLCGISPLEPGYKTFQIIPKTGSMEHASAKVPSVAGIIQASFIKEKDRLNLTAEVPGQNTAIVGVPSYYKQVSINGKVVWKDGKYKKNKFKYKSTDPDILKFMVSRGHWNITAMGQ